MIERFGTSEVEGKFRYGLYIYRIPIEPDPFFNIYEGMNLCDFLPMPKIEYLEVIDWAYRGEDGYPGSFGIWLRGNQYNHMENDLLIAQGEIFLSDDETINELVKHTIRLSYYREDEKRKYGYE